MGSQHVSEMRFPAQRMHSSRFNRVLTYNGRGQVGRLPDAAFGGPIDVSGIPCPTHAAVIACSRTELKPTRKPGRLSEAAVGSQACLGGSLHDACNRHSFITSSANTDEEALGACPRQCWCPSNVSGRICPAQHMQSSLFHRELNQH